MMVRASSICRAMGMLKGMVEMMLDVFGVDKEDGTSAAACAEEGFHWGKRDDVRDRYLIFVPLENECALRL